MHLIRIDHVSLDVHDRPASLAWYEEVLGLHPHHRHDVRDEPVFLGPAGARLGLFAERPPGLRHVALATDALATLLDGVRDVLDSTGGEITLDYTTRLFLARADGPYSNQ